jgi:hypothetical protein
MPRQNKLRLDAKLFRDIDHANRWIAWSVNTGWATFWARPNGWAEREPIVELSAMRLCEVPLAEAFDTDLLAAFQRAVQPAAHGFSG